MLEQKQHHNPEPLVTIVVVSYNHAKYLEQTVMSAIDLDTLKVKVVLLDNGSTDGSTELMIQLAQRHQLAYHVHHEPVFHPTGFMAIADQISTEYFIDLAADDVLLPAKLEHLAWFMQQSDDTAVSFSDAQLIDKPGNDLTKWSISHTHEAVLAGLLRPENMLLGRNHLCTPTAIYRTSIWKRMGGFDVSYFYEDIPYYLLVISHGYKLSYYPEVTLKRRILSDSATKFKYAPSRLMPANPSLDSTVRLYNAWLDQIEVTADIINAIVASQRNACILGYRYIAMKYIILLRKIGYPVAMPRVLLFLSPILATMMATIKSNR